MSKAYNRQHKQAPSRALLQNENMQKAIKILGAALMLTKSGELETTFTLVDELNVEHQYHLQIKEQIIRTADTE